jgi:hypothetical protein
MRRLRITAYVEHRDGLEGRVVADVTTDLEDEELIERFWAGEIIEIQPALDRLFAKQGWTMADLEFEEIEPKP